MTQQTNKIPDFKNRQEMAEWFDTHDMTDYKNEFTPVELVYELEKSKDENIVIRVQQPVKQRLEQIARSKGLNLSSLARMWLMEKMQAA